MKLLLSRSTRNFPRFPETIRQREIRGICNAVSGAAAARRGNDSGAETTVYNARYAIRILHITQQDRHHFSVFRLIRRQLCGR